MFRVSVVRGVAIAARYVFRNIPILELGLSDGLFWSSVRWEVHLRLIFGGAPMRREFRCGSLLRSVRLGWTPGRGGSSLSVCLHGRTLTHSVLCLFSVRSRETLRICRRGYLGVNSVLFVWLGGVRTGVRPSLVRVRISFFFMLWS
jgi:hypothetical protein